MLMNELNKKIVYIDMDGVIVDFKDAIEVAYNKNPEFKEKYKKNPDEIPGIFKNPKPIEGAIKAVNKMAESGKYNLFIATSATWNNPESALHKRLWIEKYFKDLFKKRLITTHRKDLLIGDYLIDDRLKNGASDFKGELLSFGWAYEKNNYKGGWNEYKTWGDILDKLLITTN